MGGQFGAKIDLAETLFFHFWKSVPVQSILVVVFVFNSVNAVNELNTFYALPTQYLRRIFTVDVLRIHKDKLSGRNNLTETINIGVSLFRSYAPYSEFSSANSEINREHDMN